MKKIFFTLTSFLFALSMSGQTTFERSYDIYNSAFSDLVFCQDDGYLMAMISLKEKYYLSFIKTDLNGDTLWTKDYDRGIANLTDLSGTEDEQGNIYIASQFGNENLLKLDKDANIIWAKRYSTVKRELIIKNNILWICSDAFPGNYLFKINPATGDSLWRSELFNLDSGSHTHTTSIVVPDNGDVVVIISPINGYDGSLMQSEFYRLTADSDQLVKFTLQTDEEFIVMDSKSIGNEIISVANDISYLTDYKTCYFIKYTSDGSIQTFTQEVFGYITTDLLKCVITNDNHVVAMGMAQIGDVLANVVLHCFSMEGDSLWTQLLADHTVLGWDIKIANDNGFVITGGKNVLIDSQPYLIKTNSLGTLNAIPEKANNLFVQVYPNPASNVAIFHTPGIKTGTLTIMNSMGEVCTVLPLYGENTTWNCNQMQPGIYFYKIVSDDRIVSGKVVRR